MADRRSPARLRAARLAAHGLAGAGLPSITAAVERLGAVQAQDLGAAKWVVGARVPGSVEADVDAAIEQREIVRSWPFRGTLHLMPAALLRPVLALTAARQIQRDATRRRELGLDDETGRSARAIAERKLSGGPRSREELQAAWEAAGIATAGQRGYHLLWWLALDGVVCLGPVDGRQQRFVLLDEWLPGPREVADRDAILAELVTRYFRGHGPATEKDAAWWTGLPLGDIRAGIAAAGDALTAYDEIRTVAADSGWPADPASTAPRATGRLALGGFDEYFLGYADRSVVCPPEHAGRVVPGGNGIFRAILVDAGRVVGVWQRKDAARGATVTVEPFDDAADPAAFRGALERWARFRGVPLHDVVLAAG
ncbi:winged helix DNA-binding domain-containing protein [Agromyces sp. G08B096]|uniref:Winged helix DNA-binding domain-containing protein n=1 Tax=Agromyces sp. G08B096 TaxID=3156399 RepID=A0AAU7WB91_9MICO